MAGETVLRQWWLVIRRAGVITQRIQVRITPDPGDTQVDPYAGPVNRDFDVIDIGTNTVVDGADASTVATYELVAAQPWEIQYLE